MTGADLRDVLLVRAAEECRPPGHVAAIPAEALVDAARAAGPLDDVEQWLARRAAFLLAGPLAPLRPLRAMTSALYGGLGVVFAAAALAGLLSNYLGPSDTIHVLFNPIAVLIAWNLASYVAAGVVRVAWRAVRARGPGAWPVPRAGTAPAPGAAATPRTPNLLARAVYRRVVPALWLRIHRGILAGAEQAQGHARIALCFWRLWLEAAGATLTPLARRALHVAAIGLAAGAVGGMYARGLVFEYNVVWRSTFLTDPEGFLGLIRAALAPAAWLLGRPLPSAEDAATLLTPAGAPAAPWIHLYAASAVLFIVVPRTALALWDTWRARRLERQARLSPGDPYVADLVARARAYHVEAVRDRIDDDVRAAVARFADDVAGFVCTRLYDASLAPAIREFRERGGTVADLERTLAERCDAFRPVLDAELPRARAAFEQDLTARVLRRLGVEPSPASLGGPDVTGTVGAASTDATRALGSQVGYGIADVVGGAVAASLAVVAGTVGGDLFGPVLGLAILEGLIASGPIAWLAGALAGLVAAGAAWWMGRDAVARGLRHVPLPAIATRGILWPGRLERVIADGRERCAARVRDLVATELERLAADIAEEIWTRIKPALGERHRPRPTDAASPHEPAEALEHPERGE